MKIKFSISDHCRQLNIPIFLLFAIGSILTAILIISIPVTYETQDPSCEKLYSGPKLWDHTYDHTRFYEWEKDTTDKKPDCITVTGKVIGATTPDKGEGDGDFHFNILADTPQYSNENNCKDKRSDCAELIAEIVCAGKPTLTSAIKSCGSYTSDRIDPKLYNFKQGQKETVTVTVTGKWVKDKGVKNDHNWNEIHPVTNVVIH